MTLTGKDGSARRKISASVALLIKKAIWTGLGLKLGL
jgi:hypothetical protein